MALAAAVKRLGRGLSLWLLLSGGPALAHATLVFGTLRSEPAAPVAGQPFTLRLELLDPSQAPVEDALVVAEFSQSPGEAPVSVRLEEQELKGVYEASLILPRSGVYQLLLRDQTFRQEEARAELQVTLGNGPLFPDEADAVVFPPTATGPQNLATWLLWLVGVPVLAGVVVTVLVLRKSPRPLEEPQSAEPDDALQP